MSGGSDDLDGAAGAALAVDHLAALLGAHADAEAELAGSLYLADFVGVMHGWSSSVSFLASRPLKRTLLFQDEREGLVGLVVVIVARPQHYLIGAGGQTVDGKRNALVGRVEDIINCGDGLPVVLRI